MYASKIYLYNQRHRVILIDTTGEYFDRRYRQVYTKNLIAHRGTDNQILIEMVNQDQKRVDITGYEFTLRLISHDGARLLLEKPLEMVNALAGQTKIVLTETELDAIAPGRVGFSIEQVSTGKPYEPVYVDDNAGGRGFIDVVDSIMPSFVESEILTIPTAQGTPGIVVSSILNTDASDLHTFQFEMDQYSGTILVEGAADTDDMWYTIQTENLVYDNLHITTFGGYHPYIRFTFTDAIDIAAGSFIIGDEYTISVPGTTDFTLIGAADSLAGTVFTATGPGTGDGTATTADPNFPGTVLTIRHR